MGWGAGVDGPLSCLILEARDLRASVERESREREKEKEKDHLPSGPS